MYLQVVLKNPNAAAETAFEKLPRVSAIAVRLHRVPIYNNNIYYDIGVIGRVRLN